MAGLARSIKARALRALGFGMPPPEAVLTDYEVWRANRACGDEVAVSPVVPESLVDFRQPPDGRRDGLPARLDLITSVAPLLAADDAAWLAEAAHHAALQAGRIAEYCRREATRPDFAAWLLLRVCAFDDLALDDLRAALVDRATGATLPLLDFEIALLRGHSDAAADLISALGDLVDDVAIRDQLDEYRGVVLMAGRRRGEGAAILAAVEARSGLERLTAVGLGASYAHARRFEEARRLLASPQARRVGRHDAIEASAGSEAAAIAAALADDPLPAIAPVEAALEAMDPPYNWPELAALLAALKAKASGREAGLAWLDGAAEAALSRWDEDLRPWNACQVAAFFYEERDIPRARAWARRTATAAAPSPDEPSWLRWLASVAAYAGDAADWSTLEAELRTLAGITSARDTATGRSE